MAQTLNHSELQIASSPAPIPLAARSEHDIARLLEALGEDPQREGLDRTPSRVWESLNFLTGGYDQTIDSVIGDAIFEERYDEMVLVQGIEFYSLCEHHMLPFFGRAHIAYIPDGRIMGLSKLPRIVDMYSRRLQVQERLTTQVAEALDHVLQPHGVAVVMEASHLCLMMRGVQKQSSQTMTSAMHGIFKTDARTRSEFLELLRHQ
ncbi:MAG TPA: GTP cyclohydrolase I FolE [Chloroflexota bacterium]